MRGKNEWCLCATGFCVRAQYAPDILHEGAEDNAKKAGAKCARNPQVLSAWCRLYALPSPFYARGVYTVIKLETDGMITMQHIFDDARQGIVWIARNPLYNAAMMQHYIKAPAWCRRAALCFFFTEMYFRV